MVPKLLFFLTSLLDKLCIRKHQDCGTHMGPLVLIGKNLVLEESRLKIEDKQVPGIYVIDHPNDRTD